MPDLKDTMAAGFEARYKKLAGRVRELAGPLSDEQFWTKPFPFGNSFGHLVLRTIRSQSPEDWSKPYTAVGSDSPDRFDIVFQCATHLDHHIGQMIYLGFEL